jgi:hypothetical protein
MAVQTVQNIPAQFVQDLGQNLAKQVLAQTEVPVVTQGLGALGAMAQPTKQDFETQEQFDTRKGLFDAQQRAALGFEQRQQALSGIAPQVAPRDALQTRAQETAVEGIGAFQPFLDRAQTQADLASGLGTLALGQVAGVPTGATAFQQGVQDFMSPFQAQVIDATLAEFDRNKAIQEQSIRDQQAALGVLGAGRAGVQLAEFGTGAARERALLQAGLLQQGFGQAQAARPQREAARQAAFLPQEQLDRFAAQVTGIMGGYPGQTQQTVTPNPTPLQTALGVGTTLAGIYGGVTGKLNPFNFGRT